jgi:hypothetical protein
MTSTCHPDQYALAKFLPGLAAAILLSTPHIAAGSESTTNAPPEMVPEEAAVTNELIDTEIEAAAPTEAAATVEEGESDVLVPSETLAHADAYMNDAKPKWLGEYTLRVGLRFGVFDLGSPIKGEPFNDSFIGSIYKLEEKQEVVAFRPYVVLSKPVESYLVGLGLSVDQLRIKTLDYGGGDGDIVMDAGFIYLWLAYDNPSRFTPFGELGWGIYDNDFEPIPSWSAGGLRQFALENSTAVHVALGLEIHLFRDCSADLYARYSDVEIDGQYVFRGDSRDPEPFTFTTDHLAYHAGINYSF